MSDLIRYQEEIGPEQSQVDSALVTLRAFVIQDEAGLEWVGSMLLSAKSRAQELEARRKEITTPMLAAKTSVDALFKPLMGKYEAAEKILKQKIADYTALVESQRRATMTASAAEYQAGGFPTAIIQEPAKVEGITVRKVWDFEITDPAEVEIGFCSPDPKKIRDWLKHYNGDPPHALGGIRFFQRDQVTARTK